MSAEQRAEALFIDFPVPPEPAAGVVHAKLAGKVLYVSGALPFAEGRMQGKGRVGLELTVDQGRAAARLAMIQALAMARSAVSSLDKIKQVVHVTAYVAAGTEFQDHAKVIEPASQLLRELFGIAGDHARTVVGVSTLPAGACVALSLIFEIK